MSALLAACNSDNSTSADSGDNNNDVSTPLAQSLTVEISEDSATTVTLLGSDSDGNDLTYSIVSSPSHGTLNSTTPNVTYTPDANYTGSDSFSYKVSNGVNESETALVTITITPVNDVPTAASQSLTLSEDNAATITLSGNDIDGDSLSYAINTSPLNGTLIGTAPNLTYIPAANYFGSDSFTFTVNDGLSSSTTTTVTLTINPINDIPVANSQSVTLDEDVSIAVTLDGTDVEGTALTYSVVSYPIKGTLTGTIPEFTYNPLDNYYGSDSFTFTVNDGSVDSTEATINLTINSINDAPTADDLSASVVKGTNEVSITLTGNDIEESELSFSIQSQPSKGDLTGTGANLTYTPRISYNGTDTFTYIANDGEDDSIEATVTIAISRQVSLNDTGVTVGSNVSCDNSNEDCGSGRDVTYNDDSDGDAGFSFTKLDENGDDLPVSATSWSCVRDNVTGLIWEVKNNTGGLHQVGYTFAFEDPVTGYGPSAGGTCGGYLTDCTTVEFANAVNAAGLCGATDWRVPSIHELSSLANHTPIPLSLRVLDSDFFPYAQSENYWSRNYTSVAFDAAWTFSPAFGFIELENFGTSNFHYVRLVRSAP